METAQQRRRDFVSYRSGCETAPDLAAGSNSLATRARWTLGTDLGSDHRPMPDRLRPPSTGLHGAATSQVVWRYTGRVARSTKRPQTHRSRLGDDTTAGTHWVFAGRA